PRSGADSTNCCTGRNSPSPGPHSRPPAQPTTPPQPAPRTPTPPTTRQHDQPATHRNRSATAPPRLTKHRAQHARPSQLTVRPAAVTGQHWRAGRGGGGERGGG